MSPSEALAVSRQVARALSSGLHIVAAIPLSRSLTELLVEKRGCTGQPCRAVLTVPRDYEPEDFRLFVAHALRGTF